MFASMLRDTDAWRDMHDEAVADAPPAGRPDLRRVLVPLGPVAVFAASNFPFAFSVAGGDTASALAAGCPVIVKAHPAHPQTSAAVGDHLRAAVDEAGAPAGTFDVVHGFESGRGLVLDSRVRAAAFTGSYEGGRALFDLAMSRADPIPFYGELGSVNPVFVTPRGAARSDELATGYVESLTLGTGQFCTNPGLLVAPRGTVLDAIVAAAARAQGGTFLYEGIASRFEERAALLSKVDGVRVLHRGPAGSGLSASVVIMATDVASALANAEALQVECFGPAGIVVEYDDPNDALAFADKLRGCLAATVHGEESEPLAAQFVSAAARIAGRVVWNGWPTGVAVSPAQHHGGPFPATTNSLHTSVGGTAIYRFLRPIAFQSLPSSLMPDVATA
jgi:NADP-dependent aldehyde dehydrogenase